MPEQKRVISAQELLKLTGNGARVRGEKKPEPEKLRDILEAIKDTLDREPNPPVEVEIKEPPDMAPLLDGLNAVARAIANSKDKIINFGQIIEPLKIIAENTRPRPKPRYNLTVIRDNRGRIEQITAVPDYGE